MAIFKSELASQDTILSKYFLQLNLLPIAVAIFISMTVLLIIQFLPPKLPLFYSLPWGEKQLATPTQFFILPAAVVLITLINLGLSWQLHPSQLFFKKILLGASYICTLLLITTFIRIIHIFI